MLQPKNPF